MKQSIASQLIEDLVWIFSLQPKDIVVQVRSVAKLFYWHLLRKKLGQYHVGTYHNNHFLYDHHSDGCATAFITPQYDYSIQTFIARVLKPGSTFVDVGANVGTETLLAAQSGAMVHSFEPTPNIFSLLQINVALNMYEKSCSLQQLAVSDTSKPLQFFIFDEGHQLLNSLVKASSKKQKTIIVQTIKLDDYFKKNAITSASVIKIDVEGAEAKVLQGAKQLLKTGKLPAIIWESNLQASSIERDKTRKILDRHGYLHFWWNADKKILEEWNNQENCFSILSSQLRAYKKLLAKV